MADFTSISIIYNPTSTGNSRSQAEELNSVLSEIWPRMTIQCIPTEHAGHAEELAHGIAESQKAPLIISSSGDGGYNEVINGVMKAKHAGSPVCAVLAAGNANDHSRTMQEHPLWQAIKQNTVTEIDLLKVSVSGTSGGDYVRYAHSYAGVGLTPVVAVELNRHTLNAFKEMWLVLKTFYGYRPFKIRHNNKELTLDSLMFMNINQMAKVLILAEKNNPTDGQFEVVSFPHGRKLFLIGRLLKAATVGLRTTRKEREYAFEVTRDTPLQLDGEVTEVQAGNQIKVTVAPKALKTIV